MDKQILFLPFSRSLSTFLRRVGPYPCRKFVVIWFVNNRRRQNSLMTRRISSHSRAYTNRLRKYTRATLSRTVESRRNPWAGILIDRLTRSTDCRASGLLKSYFPFSSLSTFFPNEGAWISAPARGGDVNLCSADWRDWPHLPRWRIRDDLFLGLTFFRAGVNARLRACQDIGKRGDGKWCIFSLSLTHHSRIYAMPMLSRRSESVRCEIPKIYGYQLPVLPAVYFTRNVDILLEYHRFEACDIHFSAVAFLNLSLERYLRVFI